MYEAFYGRRAPELSEGSRQIIGVIRRLKAEGMQSEEFARAIGAQTPRAVPPRIMLLAKELKAFDLKREDVLQRDRIYVKSRAKSVFKAGPRIDELARLIDRKEKQAAGTGSTGR